MEKIVILSVMLILPFIILRFSNRIKIIEWLGPVVCCYALGIALGNIFQQNWDIDVARSTSEVSVMLCLPLLLFSTDFPAWFKLAKRTIISFALLVLSVIVVSYLTGLFYRNDDPEMWKMAGMLAGVYVGGTPNLTAIGKIPGIREEAFIMLNAVDLVLGGAYLLFIMSAGVKLLTRFLPAFDYSGQAEEEMDVLNWKKLLPQQKILHSVLLLVLSGATVAASVFISRALTGEETASIILVSLTAFAILLSFVPKIRHFEGSQELGQYLLLVFCLAVGSMANASQLISGSWWYFLICGITMFGSIILHFLCCFFLKIDRDTAIITSMAGIFGPAFVAPIAQVLKNKAILVSGVTTGLVGMALGNFVGLAVAYLLK